jgi:hypothetical protein
MNGCVMEINTNLKSDEDPDVFSEYRAKITSILERELQQLVTNTKRESGRLTASAQQQAQYIIDQVGSNTKQEENHEVEYEIKNLLAEVKEEVKRVVAKAKKDAIQESNEILSITQEQNELSDTALKKQAIKEIEDFLRYGR